MSYPAHYNNNGHPPQLQLPHHPIALAQHPHPPHHTQDPRLSQQQSIPQDPILSALHVPTDAPSAALPRDGMVVDDIQQSQQQQQQAQQQQQQQQHMAFLPQYPHPPDARTHQMSHMQLGYPPPIPDMGPPPADISTPPPPPSKRQKSVVDNNNSPGSDPSSTKSKRIFQACQNCRERKAKCDGARPVCSHCSNRQITCEYASERRMRGPNKKRGPGDPPPKRRRNANQDFDARSQQHFAQDHPLGFAIMDQHLAGAPPMHYHHGPPLPLDRDPFSGQPGGPGNLPGPPGAGPHYAHGAPPDMDPQLHAPQHDPHGNLVAIPHPDAHHDPHVVHALPGAPAPFDAPPHHAQPQPQPQAMIAPFNPSAFPTREEFSTTLETYLSGISKKNREKALLTQAVYNDVLKLLIDGTPADQPTKVDIDPDLNTAQFRYWVMKSFTIKNIGGVDVVAHNDRAVAVKEQLYDILVHCHAETQHGGRDRTCAMVNEHYSWIPKAFVELFVKQCPGCPRKIIAANKARAAGKLPPAPGATPNPNFSVSSAGPSGSTIDSSQMPLAEPGIVATGQKRKRSGRRSGDAVAEADDSMDVEREEDNVVDSAVDTSMENGGAAPTWHGTEGGGEGATIPTDPSLLAEQGGPVSTSVPDPSLAEKEDAAPSDEEAKKATAPTSSGKRSKANTARNKPASRGSKRGKAEQPPASTGAGEDGGKATPTDAETSAQGKSGETNDAPSIPIEPSLQTSANDGDSASKTTVAANVDSEMKSDRTEVKEEQGLKKEESANVVS